MRKRFLFIGLFFILVFNCLSSNIKASDDIINTVLKGIEYNRSLIKSGIVNINVNTTVFEEGENNEKKNEDIFMAFEGRKIRFDKTYKTYAFPVKAMPKDLGGRDMRDVLKEIGTLVTVTQKIIRTDKDICIFTDRYKYLRIEEPTNQIIGTGEIFGIQTLGLALEGEQNLKFSLSQILDAIRKGRPHLIGVENLDGKSCYRIRVAYTFGSQNEMKQKIDFWVNTDSGFSIPKIEERCGKSGTNIVVEYGKVNNVWVPVSMVKELLVEQILKKKEVWQINVISLNQDVNNKLFTLSGFEMPNGTRVRDNKIGIELGKWDNGIINPEYSDKRLGGDKMPQM